MFTGIIESVGIVKRTARRGEDVLLSISTSMGLNDVAVGDSVAVSGACLTIVEVADGSFPRMSRRRPWQRQPCGH